MRLLVVITTIEIRDVPDYSPSNFQSEEEYLQVIKETIDANAKNDAIDDEAEVSVRVKRI